MKRRTLFGAALALFLGTVLGYGNGGTVTVTRSDIGMVKRLHIAWTSITNDAAGTVSWFNGQVTRVTFVPTAKTTPLITLTDGSGQDILAGLGAAPASNSVTTVCPTITANSGTNNQPMVVDSALTVVVTNCGASTGYLDLYYIGSK